MIIEIVGVCQYNELLKIKLEKIGLIFTNLLSSIASGWSKSSTVTKWEITSSTLAKWWSIALIHQEIS